MTFRHSLAALAVLLASTALQAEEAKPVDNTPKMAYGLLMQQGERLIFSPCRDRSYANVEDVSTDGSVTRALNSVGLAAGKRLYVELLGVLDNGTLKALAFNMARVEGRCQMPGGKEESWRAAGNDPAWALVAGGEYVRLQRYGKPEVVLPYTEFRSEGNVSRYDGSADRNKMAIRLEKTVCRDVQANGAFAWSASVELNGEVLRGCAWQR
ncbi:MAG: hypothetical protein CVU33_09055 [Betaproteobacteria bacterium HGW-Betaproteobacteria-6]|jgi:putative lipoprotein|nr:MAG: hypothetical protein CVU33_09055 [Betaproteobacteria bacterium HGW-Betaproteobacteria-6]